MSVSINTSEYTKTKAVEIDGKTFQLRPMSSAETLALGSLGDELKNLNGTDQQEAGMKALKQLEEMYFGLYDKPEEARKLLSGLSYEAWFDIYHKVMDGASDGKSA